MLCYVHHGKLERVALVALQRLLQDFRAQEVQVGRGKLRLLLHGSFHRGSQLVSADASGARLGSVWQPSFTKHPQGRVQRGRQRVGCDVALCPSTRSYSAGRRAQSSGHCCQRWRWVGTVQSGQGSFGVGHGSSCLGRDSPIVSGELSPRRMGLVAITLKAETHALKMRFDTPSLMM